MMSRPKREIVPRMRRKTAMWSFVKEALNREETFLGGKDSNHPGLLERLVEMPIEVKCFQ